MSVAAVAIGLAACTSLAAADDGGHATTCTGSFSGTADNLLVPSGSTCLVSAARIRNDVIVQHDASLAIERSTVGHDIYASKAQNIETGFGASLTPGPVFVGHNVTITGSDAPNAIGYDVCDTTIGNDLLIAQTQPQFEIDVGDIGPQPDEFCSYSASPPDHVGHDLVVWGNSALTIDVGNNTVGHDLIVAKNVAKSYIDVSDNRVGEDASCTANTPPPSKDGPEDGPNRAKRDYGCQ